jgi:hypothetical protein
MSAHPARLMCYWLPRLAASAGVRKPRLASGNSRQWLRWRSRLRHAALRARALASFRPEVHRGRCAWLVGGRLKAPKPRYLSPNCALQFVGASAKNSALVRPSRVKPRNASDLTGRVADKPDLKECLSQGNMLSHGTAMVAARDAIYLGPVEIRRLSPDTPFTRSKDENSAGGQRCGSPGNRHFGSLSSQLWTRWSAVGLRAVPFNSFTDFNEARGVAWFTLDEPPVRLLPASRHLELGDRLDAKFVGEDEITSHRP